MSLVFLLLLLHGAVPDVRALSLCGWRMQDHGGNNLRYCTSSGEHTLSVVNTKEALMVCSPLLPSGDVVLQSQAGPYIFCLHWVPALSLLSFTYGVTKSWTVSTRPQPKSILPPSEAQPPSFTCEPSSQLINVTINGQPVGNSCSFSFPLQPTYTDAKSVDHEISQVAHYLEKDNFFDTGQVFRGWIDATLSKVTFNGDRHHFGKGSLQAAVYKLHSAEVLNSLPDHLGISLSFPNELLETVDPGTRLQVVRIRGSGALFQDAENSTVLDSQVVGVTLEGTPVSNLSEDIVITFYHQPLQVKSSVVCVFWDELSKDWRTDGCRTVPGEHHTHCRCNHLTYFALLMQVPGVALPVPEVHLVSLSVLTFAGCSISAICCFFTIIWICCSGKMQSNPTLQIHVNLLGAVLLLDLGFILSSVLGALEEQGLCIGAAAALHFALLGTFSWMAIEGFNLYHLVVKVFPTSSLTIWKLALVGWGVPLLMVGAMLLMQSYGVYHIAVERPSSYNSTASICWLTDPIVQMLNLGICAAILLFNFCMMVAMTRRVLQLAAHTRAEKIRHCVTLLGLSCMLGLPWGLAFFSHGALYLPIQYIFSILNALQGLFIFLWYCTLSQPSAKKQSHSSDCTSATPASPRADQSLSSDHKKLLG